MSYLAKLNRLTCDLLSLLIYQLIHLVITTIAAAKLLQSCLTLCDPIDGSPPGCPIPGILQARTLEWIAISFSNAWKWKAEMKSLSRVWLFMTPWTVAYQAPPSMGFSRLEYWSGVPLPSLVHMPSRNIKVFLLYLLRSAIANLIHSDSYKFWGILVFSLPLKPGWTLSFHDSIKGSHRGEKKMFVLNPCIISVTEISVEFQTRSFVGLGSENCLKP